MIVTSTPNIEGKSISQYLGIVVGEDCGWPASP
jgi:uncharacterized protein YbjQ (UPF0145 family)